MVDLFPLLTLRFPSGSVAGSQVPREKSMAEGPSRQIMEKGNDLSVVANNRNETRNHKSSRKCTKLSVNEVKKRKKKKKEIRLE